VRGANQSELLKLLCSTLLRENGSDTRLHAGSRDSRQAAESPAVWPRHPIRRQPDVRHSTRAAAAKLADGTFSQNVTISMSECGVSCCRRLTSFTSRCSRHAAPGYGAGAALRLHRMRVHLSSSGEKDILGLAQDVGSDVGTQRFRRDQFYAVLEQIFEKETQTHEVVEGLQFGIELDEQIDVAVLTRLPTDNRAKERETEHAESFDLLTGFRQPLHDLHLRQRVRSHGANLIAHARTCRRRRNEGRSRVDGLDVRIRMGGVGLSAGDRIFRTLHHR
jgi:hypothetical protein